MAWYWELIAWLTFAVGLTLTAAGLLIGVGLRELMSSWSAKGLGAVKAFWQGIRSAASKFLAKVKRGWAKLMRKPPPPIVITGAGSIISGVSTSSANATVTYPDVKSELQAIHAQQSRHGEHLAESERKTAEQREQDRLADRRTRRLAAALGFSGLMLIAISTAIWAVRP